MADFDTAAYAAGLAQLLSVPPATVRVSAWAASTIAVATIAVPTAAQTAELLGVLQGLSTLRLAEATGTTVLRIDAVTSAVLAPPASNSSSALGSGPVSDGQLNVTFLVGGVIGFSLCGLIAAVFAWRALCSCRAAMCPNLLPPRPLGGAAAPPRTRAPKPAFELTTPAPPAPMPSAPMPPPRPSAAALPAPSSLPAPACGLTLPLSARKPMATLPAAHEPVAPAPQARSQHAAATGSTESRGEKIQRLKEKGDQLRAERARLQRERTEATTQVI